MMNKKIVIGIIVAVIVAGVGYYVWQKNQEDTATINLEGIGKMKITEDSFEGKGVNGGSFKLDEDGLKVTPPKK